MARARARIEAELHACIQCNECLSVCPALDSALSMETLNATTLEGEMPPDVRRFALSCYQCGACVPVCPVGLSRADMLLWMRMRLLQGGA